ncbi:hypothetical protein [Janthinobacterium sp. UMAB-60]|uniref:hypothetical protein n=1 Tax=Janthinobacterium sp. UMAB-60 TaxID=1365365 RepID=UPI001C588A32|nr:hypothetical protein [Janthinobacterium sp. UMAB-60]
MQQSGVRKAGLLGVKQTMAGSFYHQALGQCGIVTVTVTVTPMRPARKSCRA